MIQASKIKKNSVLDIAGKLHIVDTITCQSPSARGGSTLYKIRTRDLITGQKTDHSFKSDEMLKEGEYEKRPVEFSYIEGSNYIFMDLETYDQFELNFDFLGDDKNFLLEGMELTALLIDGAVKTVTLPDTVQLTVTECDPSIKSASATARTKNAVLETGYNLQVPEYLESGELIKVDTRSGEFISRAK
jgi:elongation factor P